MAEGMSEAVPGAEPWSVLSGPDNAIWDDIFDWIANSTRTIIDTLTSWIARQYQRVVDGLTFFIGWTVPNIIAQIKQIPDRLASWGESLWDLVVSQVSSLWGKITSGLASLTSSIRAWFSELPSMFDYVRSWLGDRIQSITDNVSSIVRSILSQLSSELSATMSYLVSQVSSRLDQVLLDIRQLIPEWLKEPGQWISVLLDGAADWFLEDIPGHSPRWTGILESVFDFFRTWLYDFPRWFGEDLPERVAYGLQESFQWVSDTIEPVFETFNQTILGFASTLGYMSPETAKSNFNTLAKVGFTAIAGLTGMTVAGELIHPLKNLGLGNISAMVWDMTNYKVITGAFVGAMTYSMVQQPLRYYFQSMFRPMLLREADFTELLSRRAFSDPETLQNPELTEAVNRISGGHGAAFESAMIGYYGYRPEYLGLFRELANTRLGYFALAGVARSGFWDEAWFREALARTGYSETARNALLGMMYEQFTYAKLSPVLSQLRKLYREGFTTRENVQATLAEVLALPNMDEVRLVSLDLEREYEIKSTTLDITLRAFSRGVISEKLCRSTLDGLGIPEEIVTTQLLREKLGLIRRISWSAPQESTSFQFVEE